MKKSKGVVIGINCNAVYSDGIVLMKDYPVVSEVKFSDLDVETELNTYKLIDIRLAVPFSKSEQLLNGLKTGVVELYVEGMTSEVELA